MNELASIFVYTHRGLHQDNFPNSSIRENSLSAFQAAIASNLAIECDIRLTKDNQLVVFHDANTKRLTGADHDVSELTLKQCQALTLLGSNDKILSFNELLDVVNGQVFLLIEIKNETMNQTIVNIVSQKLKTYPHSFALKSFNWRTLYLLKKKHPQFLCGKLVTRFNPFQKIYNWLSAINFNEDFLSIHVHHLSHVKNLANYPKPVLTWTINSPQTLAIANQYTNHYIMEQFSKE